MIGSEDAKLEQSPSRSAHESETRQIERIAAKENLPVWVVLMLSACVVFTFLWVVRLLSLVL